MDILKRIIKKYNSKRRKHLIFKRIKSIGGKIWKFTKTAFLGEFKFGRNLMILGDGIDNFARSQIVILPGTCLEVGDNVGMTQISINCNIHVNKVRIILSIAHIALSILPVIIDGIILFDNSIYATYS